MQISCYLCNRPTVALYFAMIDKKTAFKKLSSYRYCKYCDVIINTKEIKDLIDFVEATEK